MTPVTFTISGIIWQIATTPPSDHAPRDTVLLTIVTHDQTTVRGHVTRTPRHHNQLRTDTPAKCLDYIATYTQQPRERVEAAYDAEIAIQTERGRHE